MRRSTLSIPAAGWLAGWLAKGLGYGDGTKGGRPPFDPVSMFKALILPTQHNLSDARMEFMIPLPGR
jgi:IS5 family transposase